MKLDLQVRHLNKKVARMDSAIEGTLGEPNYTLIGEDGNNVAAIINANVRVITPTNGQRFSVMRALGELEGSGDEAALNALSWDLVHNASGVNSRVRGIFGVVKLRSTSANSGVRGIQSVTRAEAGTLGDMTAVIGQIEPVTGMGEANAFQSTLNSSVANKGVAFKASKVTGTSGTYEYGLLLDHNSVNYGTAAIRLPTGTVSGRIEWGASGAYLRNNSSSFLEIATRLGLNVDPERTLHVAINDAASLEMVRLENLATDAALTKLIVLGMYGRSTGGAQKEVGKIITRPADNDWEDSKLEFYSRRSDAIEHLVEMTGDIADSETCLLIKRNVGGVFSLARVTMGAVDSGGSGFKLLRVPN